MPVKPSTIRYGKNISLKYISADVNRNDIHERMPFSPRYHVTKLNIFAVSKALLDADILPRLLSKKEIGG